LTEIDGLTQAQAADRLGLSLPGMKSRVQRGRQQLEEMLIQCCAVERDVRGGLTDYRPRHGPCGCGPGQGSPAAVHPTGAGVSPASVSPPTTAPAVTMASDAVVAWWRSVRARTRGPAVPASD